MAVITIERTNWIDDDGSGTTGTVLNNAIKTELYGQIDGALAQLAPGSNGLLNITTFGTNYMNAGGTGYNNLVIQNPTDGAANGALLDLRAGSVIGQVVCYAPSFTTSGVSVAASTLLIGTGAGGVGVAASHGSGAIRFYTGGTTERWRIATNGNFQNADLVIGTSFTIFGAGQNYFGAPGTAATQLLIFYNVNGPIGNVSVAGTTTTYNTTSDQRLKEDLGIAEDLTALRAVVVHDFIWSAHGGHDRGIFAQETYPVFPRAVSVGTPGDDLAQPWMTDYSKFVPDLIVGWQEHDRRLARLESLVNEKD